MLTFSSFDKCNACVTARNHSVINTVSSKNIHFDEAVIVKDVMKGYLSGDIQIKEIPEIISEAYTELSEITKQQEEREKLLSKILTRACRGETRKNASFPPKKLIRIPEMDVSFDGIDNIYGGPDVVFEGDDYIELVMYKKGVPAVKSRGTHTPKEEIPMYLLLQYGKSLVEPGETKKLIVSYYYMKKNTDNSTSAYTDDFFDGKGGNVISLEETFTCPGEDVKFEDYPKSELDKHFQKKFEEFAVGYECSGDDCKGCRFDNVCNYKKAPELQDEKEVKARKKITPSEAQQKIIDAKNGYFKVNAGAGAGKTECVSERFLSLVKFELESDT